MDRALLPVVRASRLSRSLWLVPTLLVMVLSCSFAGYVAGYFDGKDTVRHGQPLVPAPLIAPAEPVTVVNVAAGVTEFFPLLGLRPREHVTAINDMKFSADANTRSPFYHREKLTGGYFIVTTTQRQFVVLFH